MSLPQNGIEKLAALRVLFLSNNKVGARRRHRRASVPAVRRAPRGRAAGKLPGPRG
jgi:hypothetical protein